MLFEFTGQCLLVKLRAVVTFPKHVACSGEGNMLKRKRVYRHLEETDAGQNYHVVYGLLIQDKHLKLF